jgi:hypothetical protein
MKTILAVFAACLLTFAAKAQPTTLNITLTATYQLPNVTSGPTGNITTSITKAAKITSDTLLRLIEIDTGESFVKGSYLAQDGGNVEVLDQSGNSTDVSSYFTINNTSGALVGSGVSNSDTGKTSGGGLIYTIVAFDDGNGNAFTVDGLIRETVSETGMNSNGVQIETGSYSGAVVGYGTVVDAQGNTDTAVFSGTFSGSGKGPAGS